MPQNTRASLHYLERHHRTTEPRLVAGAGGVPPRELLEDYPDVLAMRDAYAATFERMRERGRTLADLRAKLDAASSEFRAARRAAADAGEDPAKVVDKSPKIAAAITALQDEYEADTHTCERQGRDLGLAIQGIAPTLAAACEDKAREAVTRAREAHDALTAAEADYRHHAGIALSLHRLALYGGSLANFAVVGKGLPGLSVPAVDFDTAASLPDVINAEVAAVRTWRAEQTAASESNTSKVRATHGQFTP